jgi:uncharacterized protein YeaO (DUF488 family)
MLSIKRVYHPPSPRDGMRVLVDRVWPRGISKERARIVGWRKEVAPSAALRKWFGHDPARWPEFRRRYEAELKGPRQQQALKELADLCQRRRVTLVYGAADEQHNQAVVLKDVLENLARTML